MQPPFPVHTLDPTLSLAILGGLFVVRARAVPRAEGVRNLLTRMKVARPSPWGSVHFYELDHVGLPDEAARTALGELTRDAKESNRCTALVTERVLMQSIVRSVVSGLRLLTGHDGRMETFASLDEAVRWLESQRPAGARQVDVDQLTSALEALRQDQR